MARTAPPSQQDQLKCPLCRRDISGHLSYADLREWLKRRERKLALAHRRLRAADRKRAAVFLRRLVFMETGQLNVSENGKPLGLRPLSESLVDVIWKELFSPSRLPENGLADYAALEQDEFKLELARLIEKRIIDYFTLPYKPKPANIQSANE